MKNYLKGGASAAIAGAAMLLSFAATPAEAQAPGGSYLQTCTNVRAHGDRVSATCRRTDGRWQRSAIKNVDRCAGGLANANGNLTCGRTAGPRFGERDDRHDNRWYRDHRGEGYGSSDGSDRNHRGDNQYGR